MPDTRPGRPLLRLPLFKPPSEKLNLLLGDDVKIEWRPKLRLWDGFRLQDMSGGFYPQYATLRTGNLFEACCFVLSPHKRPASKVVLVEQSPETVNRISKLSDVARWDDSGRPASYWPD